MRSIHWFNAIFLRFLVQVDVGETARDPDPLGRGIKTHCAKGTGPGSSQTHHQSFCPRLKSQTKIFAPWGLDPGPESAGQGPRSLAGPGPARSRRDLRLILTKPIPPPRLRV